MFFFVCVVVGWLKDKRSSFIRAAQKPFVTKHNERQIGDIQIHLHHQNNICHLMRVINHRLIYISIFLTFFFSTFLLLQGICPGNRLKLIPTYDSGCYTPSPAPSPCPSTPSIYYNSSILPNDSMLYENTIGMASLQQQRHGKRRSWHIMPNKVGIVDCCWPCWRLIYGPVRRYLFDNRMKNNENRKKKKTTTLSTATKEIL